MAKKTHTPPPADPLIVHLTARQLIKALFFDLKQIKWMLLLGCLVTLLGVLLGVAAPGVIGGMIDVIDGYVSSGVFDRDKFTTLILIAVGLYVFTSGFNAVKTIILNRTVSRHFTCKLRIRMSDKIKRLPVSYIDGAKKGEIIERMTEDVSNIGSTVHNVIDMAIIGIFQLVIIIVVVFTIQPILAALVVALVPISVLISMLLAKHMSKNFEAAMTEFGVQYANIDEDYAGIKTIRAYALEDHMKERFKKSNEKIRVSTKKAYFAANMIQPIIAFTNKIGYVVIALLGGFLAIRGGVSVGDVVAIILYAAQISSPLESISQSMGMLQRTAASAKRVYGMLAMPEMTRQTSDEILTAGDVTFDHVNFSYVPDKPILKDMNLNLGEGQKIAIVGPTGGGKTTVVNLLMRFYDPTSGSIRIGGKDIADFPREQVRDLFSMVLQDTWLFTGSIAENVSYGYPNASREEVVRACEETYCDKFIRTLPGGYDEEVSEEASDLSGGQKQLLTIARAYLANRPMLILDEATSNVDTRTEILLQKAMDKLMQGKTCFVIAHRLSTIVNADRILVVSNGEVVEQGTHAELLEQRGTYYTLYQSQYAIK